MDRPGETMQADDSAPAPREQRVTVDTAEPVRVRRAELQPHSISDPTNVDLAVQRQPHDPTSDPTVHAAAQDPWRPPKDALASKRGARSSLKRPPCAGARASPTPEADDLLSLVPRALSYGLLGVRVHGPVVLIVLDTGQWAQLGRPRERVIWSPWRRVVVSLPLGHGASRTSRTRCRGCIRGTHPILAHAVPNGQARGAPSRDCPAPVHSRGPTSRPPRPPRRWRMRFGKAAPARRPGS